VHDTTKAAGHISPANKNIGDLMNAKGITWGGFMGGYDLTIVNPNGTTRCARSTFSSVLGGKAQADYTNHHNWFQYYASTANPTHARPSSLTTIGFSTLADGKTPEPKSRIRCPGLL
jgi:phospholipase C